MHQNNSAAVPKELMLWVVL